MELQADARFQSARESVGKAAFPAGVLVTTRGGLSGIDSRHDVAKSERQYSGSIAKRGILVTGVC